MITCPRCGKQSEDQPLHTCMKTEPETSAETVKCSDTPRTDFVYYEFNPAPQGVMVNALHEHAQELEKELTAFRADAEALADVSIMAIGCLSVVAPISLTLSELKKVISAHTELLEKYPA